MVGMVMLQSFDCTCSSDIQSALLIDANAKAVEEFSSLVNFVQDLQVSQCTKLVSFANSTLMFWFEMLKDRFAR